MIRWSLPHQTEKILINLARERQVEKDFYIFDDLHQFNFSEEQNLDNSLAALSALCIKFGYSDVSGTFSLA